MADVEQELADVKTGRTISNDELERRIETWFRTGDQHQFGHDEAGCDDDSSPGDHDPEYERRVFKAIDDGHADEEAGRIYTTSEVREHMARVFAAMRACA